MVIDCILHMPVCFKNRNEIGMLEKNLNRFREPKFNSFKGAELAIYVSVNGQIKGKYYNQLKKLAVKYDFNLFKRENIGYQWGGFYDVWKMNLEKPANWYVTLEVDCYFMPRWFDKLVEASPEGYVGAPPIKITHKEPYPKRWQGSPGKRHTNGAFDFCSKDLLEKIDNKFGCFTDATGCDHVIDGILHGEVGFCQKVLKFCKLKTIEGVQFRIQDGNL